MLKISTLHKLLLLKLKLGQELSLHLAQPYGMICLCQYLINAETMLTFRKLLKSRLFDLAFTPYTLNNIGSPAGTIQYYYHATPSPSMVLLGLHGNSTEGFFSMNLYCLD